MKILNIHSRMQMIKFNKFSLFLIAIILTILPEYTNTEKIKILDYSSQIEFAKIQEFSLKFNELIDQTSEFYFRHSFLSIISNVTLDEDCIKKATCGQPIRIYGKINDKPRPEDIFYDKKDDTGNRIENSDKILYGFEYSPCQLNLNDTLHIKMVGVEGKSNFTLQVSFDYLPNYKVLCAGGIEPQITIHSQIINTPNGTIKFGGKLNLTHFDENIYLLESKNKENLNWKIVERKDKNSDKPEARYGHYLTYFENYLILFGGNNLNEESLNDLWVFDLTEQNWMKIDYSNSKNIPKPKFLPAGEHLQNFGSILIFGGHNNFDDNNIYLMNLKILLEIVEYKKSLNNLDINDDTNLEYYTKINHLFQIKEVRDLIPRYGLTITQIKENEVILFGGFDRNHNSLSRLEILNLNDFSVKVIEPNSNNESEFPSARGNHQILKYGSILILYGGKSGRGENLNDMWKFIINSKKWVRVEEKNLKETEFYLFKSGFSFTKLENSERPLMIGGENKNKENSNNLVLMDFEICTSDIKILSSHPCIPCEEGYMLTDQKKCEPCEMGSYLKIFQDYYSDSKCEKCPMGKFNDKINQKNLSSCKICEFGFFNNKIGQTNCEMCHKDEVCLPGQIEPVKDEFLLKNVDTNFNQDFNFPDYLDANNKIKIITRTSAIIIVGAITGTMILILLIFYKLKKTKTSKFLIYMDFLPLTGGQIKKCSGGLITAIYSILILSLAFSFVMRYIYFNQLIEVIPLSNSNNDMDSLKSSFLLNVEIIGNDFNCLNREQNFNQCSRDLEIIKVNHNNYFNDNFKALMCSKTSEGHCKVTFKCEDCKSIENNDIIQISIKNSNSFVQVYKWSFESVWDDNFNYQKGFSKIEGIFKPDNDIKSGRVFKGESPSAIQILLTPIFYKKDGIFLSGYRSNLKQYSRGDVRDEFSFYKNEEGVKLNIQFFYATNSYQVNSKNQIDFLDFCGFILGMLAGLSFFSRISKYFCERCQIFDMSLEYYIELEESEEKKEEKLEKLDNNENVNENNINKTEVNIEIPIHKSNNNNDIKIGENSAASQTPLNS